MSSEAQTIELDAVEEVLAAFPPLPHGSGNRPSGTKVYFTSYRPLNAEDAAAVQRAIDQDLTLTSLGGHPPPSIKSLRLSHHRLAELLAEGVQPTIAARMCNYTVGRVVSLQADPAFQELLAHYTTQRTAESSAIWADFNTTAKALSLDLLSHIQEMLDTTPERFTPSLAAEVLRTVADRSGNAPVSKNLNLNVNSDVGTRLNRAKARMAQITSVTDTPS